MLKKTLWIIFGGLIVLKANWGAAFTVRSTQYLHGFADLTSQIGVAFMQIEYKNIDGTNPNSQVQWNPDEVVLGASQWQRAQTYMVVFSSLTAAGAGIQIYTDNKEAGYTGDENPAGLFSSDEPKATPLPMAWRVVDVSTHTGDGTPGNRPALSVQRGATAAQTVDKKNYPDRLWVTELGPDYPCFLWMLDKNTPDIDTTVTGKQTFATNPTPLYARVIDVEQGIQHAESTWGLAKSPDYIYFSADFTNAQVGQQYAANVVVELFTE